MDPVDPDAATEPLPVIPTDAEALDPWLRPDVALTPPF